MSEQLTMSMSEFLSAGLEPEGIYRLKVVDGGIVERTGQNGPYQQISLRVALVERLGDGPLEKQPTEYLNCGTSGRGLARFRKLFVAATGGLPEGEDITLTDLVAALINNENAWTTYQWKRNNQNPDDIEGQLGWSYSDDPSKLKEPRPFAERDAA